MGDLAGDIMNMADVEVRPPVVLIMKEAPEI